MQTSSEKNSFLVLERATYKSKKVGQIKEGQVLSPNNYKNSQLLECFLFLDHQYHSEKVEVN